jgi:acyl-homoserine-lactone acylase
MKKLWLVLATVTMLVAPRAYAQAPTAQEIQRWERQAQAVNIIRDDWGIAHVYGRTDADVVFGMIYAQAEDDWNRVETNYLTQLGRLAEAEGEARIFADLKYKIFADPAVLQREFNESPAWLKALMTSWADGLNFYLYEHPTMKPRVITRWEPWMALSFTEGSIGGDISGVNTGQLQTFYSSTTNQPGDNYIEEEVLDEPGGSNGMAVAPSNTTTGHALLLINPHTSHYFRSELQMVSEEGLNAYGAVTWGQFFIYQGFNEGAGWMHTTSATDGVDEYAETIVRRGNQIFYKYGTEERPVQTRQITVRYKDANGSMAQRTFTTYRTHHGPIVRAQGDKWVAVKMMEDHVKALTQSYTRTKARDYDEFRRTMELHTNTSNNTIFADSKGNIAYFHANYVPKRDDSFTWNQPVDGSDPRTEWQGMTGVEESPFLKNPSTGWLYNANDWPWDAAGPASPKRENYPRYLAERGSGSARGQHAVLVLQNKKDFTLDGLVAAAYDSYLPWFEKPLPALIRAFDALPASDPLKTKLAEPVAQLRGWNMRFSTTSVPTALGVFWGTEANGAINQGARGAGGSPDAFLNSPASAQPLLQALSTAVDKLTADFGTWRTPWGDINRMQRFKNTIAPEFDDTAPSVPVGFTAATWGSLASHSARAYPNTKKWYGTSGNSFVAVVEFGPQVRARAVTAGGESGDPASPHFKDQLERFATGNLRDVYFYRNQLNGHIEKEYRPGSEVR